MIGCTTKRFGHLKIISDGILGKEIKITKRGKMAPVFSQAKVNSLP